MVAGKGIKEHGNGAIMGDMIDLYIHEITGTTAKRRKRMVGNRRIII